MTDRLTFQELVQRTTGKHTMRFLQTQGFFTSNRDGLYDEKWIEVYHEAKSYMRAGFDEISAYCEATRDVFGWCPDWYEG